MFGAFLVSLEFYELFNAFSADYHKYLPDSNKIIRIIIKCNSWEFHVLEWCYALFENRESKDLFVFLVIKTEDCPPRAGLLTDQLDALSDITLESIDPGALQNFPQHFMQEHLKIAKNDMIFR